MSWNQGAPLPKNAERSSKPSMMRGVLAGAIVMALSGIGLYFILSSAPDEEAVANGCKKSIGTIAASTNSAPTAAISVGTNKLKTVEKEPFPPLQPGEHRTVHWKRPANWDQLSPQEKTRIQPVARVIKPVGWDRKQLFERISDKKIERLLSIKPGQRFIGSTNFGPRFTQDFLDSLKTPIIVTKDDSPEEAEMKRAVIAVRMELKDAYDRGEDIGKMMSDSEQQLREMANYKDNLRKEILSLRKNEGYSVQDMDDFLSAANKMLEDKGMEPLKMGSLIYSKAMLDKQNSK